MWQMQLKDLQRELPFKFRIWSWCGSSKTENGKKIYEKYIVLGYIDSRDAMNLLDEVVWPENRQRDHKEIKWNLYAGVGIKINNDWVWKWDCGVESNTEAEKGESSDSFKRACVNRWIWRFLYDLPTLRITREEANKNAYNLTEFVKSKFAKELEPRFPKPEFTEEIFEKLKEACKWKDMKEIVKLTEQWEEKYRISEEMNKKITLFLESL